MPQSLPSSDPEAFRAIYTAHLPYVARTLRRLGVPERHLEDVAHDAFVVIHRQLSTFDRSRPVKPWLFGIAFRVSSEFRRRAQNRREHLEEPSTPPSVPPEAEAALEARRAQTLVSEALEALPEAQRAVFILHELDGEPVPAVAAALGVPLNTAYSRLRLGRQRFTERVRELAGLGGER